MEDNLIITPKTKIGDLLKAYPALEDKLIELSPSFKKLKNPIIRKTVAKLATIDQAAKIGELKTEELVNALRKEVGQDSIKIESADENPGGRPSWVDDKNIKVTYDARDDINGGGHPLGKVLGDIKSFSAGEQYKLIAPFLPAPLIEKVKDEGFDSWTNKISDNLFENYFIKK